MLLNFPTVPKQPAFRRLKEGRRQSGTQRCSVFFWRSRARGVSMLAEETLRTTKQRQRERQAGGRAAARRRRGSGCRAAEAAGRRLARHTPHAAAAALAHRPPRAARPLAAAKLRPPTWQRLSCCPSPPTPHVRHRTPNCDAMPGMLPTHAPAPKLCPRPNCRPPQPRSRDCPTPQPRLRPATGYSGAIPRRARASTRRAGPPPLSKSCAASSRPPSRRSGCRRRRPP